MVEIGLQVFLKSHKSILRGRRVGLVTHAPAVTPAFVSAVDALLGSGVKLTALFGPEHGLDGSGSDATPIDDRVDSRTGLPVFSLYGRAKAPAPATLSQVDVLVFDMQDVGARFYTYISTLDYILRAAESFGLELIVLDRPNPLNGNQIEGPLVDPGLESFISHVQVPIRHALTMGELARFIAGVHKRNATLNVVPMRGWERRMWFDDTGLPWVPLSPAMPHFETGIVYPGMCLVEGTNLSEGRGTALPFEIVGAPWLDGYALAHALNRLDLPGVRFRPHSFTPSDSKYRGTLCSGVQVHVTRRSDFRPVQTGLHVLAACRAQDPDRFQFLDTSWEGTPPHLDLLVGNAKVRQGLLASEPVENIVADWRGSESAFRDAREFALLYE